MEAKWGVVHLYPEGKLSASPNAYFSVELPAKCQSDFSES